MSKKYFNILLLSFVTLFLINITGCGQIPAKKQKIKAKSYEIIKVSDVNADGKKEDILLIHQLDLKVNYIKLVIKNSKDKKVLFEKVLEGNYFPNLFIGDFNGDKVNEIFTGINSGGSSGAAYYNLFSFKKNKLKSISLEGINAKDIDNEITENMIRLSSNQFNINYSSKLSEEQLRRHEEEWGSRNNLEGYFAPGWIEPIDISNDGVYEFKYENTYLLSKFESLADIEMVFKYNKVKSTWEPITLQIKPANP